MKEPIILHITPRPSPRPRHGRTKEGKPMTYNPSWYTKYKKDLVLLIKSHNLPIKNYGMLFVTIGIPYPKQVKGGDKSKIESLPNRSAKGDTDNFVKGIKDALEQAGILHNDCQIYYEGIAKLWTRSSGYIQFFLSE